VTATGNVLRPEHSVSTEAGVRTALAKDVATLDVAAFRIDNQNFAVADPDNPNFQHNIGEALSTGFEAMATMRAGKLLRGLASYAYTDARIVADPAAPERVGEPLPLAAAHSGGVWGQLDVPTFRTQKAGLGIGALYTSERALPDQSTIPGYVRLDAVVSYALAPIRAAVRIENLADTRYTKSGLNQYAVLPGAPRSVFFTLEARL
jgi:outer membrane receptor protein involved in Fe transport